MAGIICSELIKELEAESGSTRKCLERVPFELFGWKPHEKSMTLGYLALLVAEIPKWITHMIENNEIDFATFEHFQAKTSAELLRHFDENFEGAVKSIQSISDEDLSKSFSLKNHGHLIFSSPLHDNIGSSINHLVHHRGQLTVYLRLNNIPIPSIYGPSADEKNF